MTTTNVVFYSTKRSVIFFVLTSHSLLSMLTDPAVAVPSLSPPPRRRRVGETASTAAVAPIAPSPSPLETMAIRSSTGRTFDLTYLFDEEETIYWPTAKNFTHEKVFRGLTDQGFYYEANNFQGAEHGGTHMDAPAHFCNPVKCWRTHEIPADRLHGEGVIVDVSHRIFSSSSSSTTSTRDYRVSVADLKLWEETTGRKIPEGAIVLLHTGWGRFWGDETKYLGNDRGNTSNLHFPGLHPVAASWLVSERPWVSMVGIDTASIDYGPSADFSAHRTLLGANVPVLENVAHLDGLLAFLSDDAASADAKRIRVYALPMKIKDGSGGPTRIIARSHCVSCRRESSLLRDEKSMGSLARVTASLSLLLPSLSAFVVSISLEDR